VERKQDLARQKNKKNGRGEKKKKILPSGDAKTALIPKKKKTGLKRSRVEKGALGTSAVKQGRQSQKFDGKPQGS